MVVFAVATARRTTRPYRPNDRPYRPVLGCVGARDRRRTRTRAVKMYAANARAVVAMARRAVARAATTTATTTVRGAEHARAGARTHAVRGGGASGGRGASGWTALEEFLNARGRASGAGGGKRGGGSTSGGSGGGRGAAEDAATRRGARAMATAIGLDPGSRIQVVLAKIAMRDAMDALGVFEYEEDEDT